MLYLMLSTIVGGASQRTIGALKVSTKSDEDHPLRRASPAYAGR